MGYAIHSLQFVYFAHFHLTLQAADVSSSESSLVTDTIKFEESNRI